MEEEKTDFESDCKEVISLVRKQLGDDKALEWFTTRNPFLGNISPLELIARGRIKKLLKWVTSTISEGKREDEIPQETD